MSRNSLKTVPHVRKTDLFGVDPAWPNGLRYAPEFVSAEEERALIRAFQTLSLAPFQFGAFQGKRRVASFGVHYDFSDQRLHPADAPPEFIQPIVARVEHFGELKPGTIRHLLFTEYETGAGIGWHRDKAVFDLVFGLSLAAPCRFRFRRKIGGSWKRFALEAEARSLYVLSGEARSAWEHSIPEVDTLRYSVTFRTMAR